MSRKQKPLPDSDITLGSVVLPHTPPPAVLAALELSDLVTTLESAAKSYTLRSSDAHHALPAAAQPALESTAKLVTSISSSGSGVVRKRSPAIKGGFLLRSSHYTSPLSPISERGEDSERSELDHTAISTSINEFESIIAPTSIDTSVQSSAAIPNPIPTSPIVDNTRCLWFEWKFPSFARSR